MPYNPPLGRRSTQPRKKPQIPVNKLGEYIEASAVRRESILRELKYVKPFKGAMRYSRARKVLVEYFADHHGDESFLRSALGNLGPNPFGRKTENAHRASCRAAISSFLANDFSQLGIRVVDPVFAEGDIFAQEYLSIENVTISMRPDLVIRGEGPKGCEVTGVLKFHFGKDFPLGIEGGAHVATLLHQYAEEKYGSEHMGTPRELCLLLDVRQGTVHEAPSSYKRRRKLIAASCREIAARWDSL